MRRIRKWGAAAGFVLVLAATGRNAVLHFADIGAKYARSGWKLERQETSVSASVASFFQEIPEYSGEAYVEVHGNEPELSLEDGERGSFEQYSALDALGRCGTAYANLGTDLMPTRERTSIGSVKPSGWQTVKYDCVDGNYLYNRCHLIGYQLSGENAKEENLITGTRYLNVTGMLPFENMVADYLKETGNHVLYRVTPIYEEKNLVASGVWMEALSVEDQGEGICFSVYCYNVQPGITIDYATGASWEEAAVNAERRDIRTVWITDSGSRYHKDPQCSRMKDSTELSVSEAQKRGYKPCKKCAE